jgi:hypothetical protein
MKSLDVTGLNYFPLADLEVHLKHSTLSTSSGTLTTSVHGPSIGANLAYLEVSRSEF